VAVEEYKLVDDKLILKARYADPNIDEYIDFLQVEKREEKLMLADNCNLKF
jgi:hypothetical protein